MRSHWQIFVLSLHQFLFAWRFFEGETELRGRREEKGGRGIEEEERGSTRPKMGQ